MNTKIDSLMDYVRQPEYTGKNRCGLCTLTNGVIAIILAAALAPISLIISLAVLGVSAVSIYYRGYLIPGTPTLTKRYFPKSLLRLFGKTATTIIENSPETTDSRSMFVKSGILKPCNGQEICLADSFRTRWNQEMNTITEHEEYERLRRLLQTTDIMIEENENNCIVYGDNSPLMLRESHSALRADLAAIPELRDWYQDWSSESLSTRNDYLSDLRLFLDICPACGSSITFVQDTVDSCCESTQQVAMLCDECGERLVEIEH